MPNRATELTSLANIGKTLERELKSLGIDTLLKLERIGSVQAYIQLCVKAERRLPVCYYLYSLEGAIQGRNWRTFSIEEKDRLKSQVSKNSALSSAEF